MKRLHFTIPLLAIFAVTQLPSRLPAARLVGPDAGSVATELWAVGSFTDPREPHNQQTLIEHWDGVAWSQAPSPNVALVDNVLEGVTAVTASDAWAVGNINAGRGTVILHWDGARWQIAPSPNIAGSDHTTGLHDVAAIAANDVWAIGNNDGGLGTVVEHWDGAAWSIVPSPNRTATNNHLNSLSIVSANDIWAVENNSVIHWDGTNWDIEYPTSMHMSTLYLWDVDATSSDNVWVVGEKDNSQALVLHWNGAHWIEVQGPTPMPMQRALGVAVWANEVWVVGEAFYDWEGTHYPMAARFVKRPCPTAP